jgi:sulfoxide reductase heme-binding subunit YedZ
MNGPLASAASPLWYLTRGSGVVTLVLLTAALCLGVASAVRWHTRSLPRFVVAELHRRLTLLAVVFLAIHVATTIADGFTSIGVSDAFVPFLARYRPLWLGLGAVACDLLLALVVSSLLRVRLGHRAWRLTHWLAYAAWPVAELHSLGTGSDARYGWMAGVGFGCLFAVALAVVVRVGQRGLRPALAAGVVVAACSLGLIAWYQSGPARRGWAARSGTPAALLASRPAQVAVQRATARGTSRRRVSLPARFEARLSGSVSQSSPNENGLVTVRIDVRVRGRVGGELRIALQGAPDDGGGIILSSSGVAFQGEGPTPVYEGSVVALNGTDVVADLADSASGRLRLVIALRIDQLTGVVSGTLRGARP